jgi:hypothetical protein
MMLTGQTSAFEEEALKIKIIEETSYKNIFGSSEIDVPEHMELSDFDYDKILTFKPSDHPRFSMSFPYKT